MGINQSEPILAAARAGNVDPRAAIIADNRVRYERLKAKYPQLVQVEQPQMFPEILQTYNVCSYHLEELTKVGRKVIDPLKAQLPCVLITNWVRDNFAEEIKQLPEKARRAKFLYNAEDVEEELHEFLNLIFVA